MMKNLGFNSSMLRSLSKCLAYIFLLAASSTAFALQNFKEFIPSSIPQGGQSILQITIHNNDNVPGTMLFVTDDLTGTGITLASTTFTQPAMGSNCGALSGNWAVGSTLVTLTGGTVSNLMGMNECIIQIPVTSNVVGPHVNTIIGGPENPQIGYTVPAGEGTRIEPGDTVSATLNVTAAAIPTPPVVGKSFNPTSIAPGQTSTLRLTFTNNNTAAASSLNATDNLVPSNLFVAGGATQNTCTGTLTAVVGSQSITLSGGSLAAMTSCFIEIPVTASTDGAHVNSLSSTAVSFVVQETTLNGNPISATLAVVARPTIAKIFSPDDVECGCSKLVITLSNPSNTAATLTSPFVDRFPSDLKTVGFAATTCIAGSVSTGNSSITLQAGAIISANSFCTISVNVESKCNGEFTNRIAAGALATSNGSNLLGAQATVNFCCEDSHASEVRQQCLSENAIDVEENISPYVE